MQSAVGEYTAVITHTHAHTQHPDLEFLVYICDELLRLPQGLFDPLLLVVGGTVAQHVDLSH